MDSKRLFLTLDKEKPVTSMPIAHVFSYDVEIHRQILNKGSILSIEAAIVFCCYMSRRSRGLAPPQRNLRRGETPRTSGHIAAENNNKNKHVKVKKEEKNKNRND